MSTTTPDLLPDDVFVEPGDAPSPKELLAFQATRIEERTAGRIKVELTESELEDRTLIRFTVVVPAHNYRCVLFEIVHRPNLILPASFVPPEPLPAYLRERYVEAPRGSLNVLSYTAAVMSQLNKPRTVENQWIANTPSEFQAKLQKLLGSQEVKALLSSLVAMAAKPPETNPIPNPSNGVES